MLRRLARALVHITLVLAIIALSGATYAAHAEQVQRGELDPPGRLVDIGGGQLIHVRTWGTRSDGAPALLLDASAATPSSEWAWIGSMLAAQGHYAVAHDRPGLAWSTGPDRPRDAESAAKALRQALSVAGIEPPYVVIGHSYGGFSARAFTGLYSEDVAGLALLDTTDPEGDGGQALALPYRLMSWRAALGIYALTPRRTISGSCHP